MLTPTDVSPAELKGDDITAHHLAALRAGKGAATHHCSRLVMQPPSLDLQSFAFLSHLQGEDVVQAAGRPGGAGRGIAAPLHAMHAHCPMFARKFPGSERDQVLGALQQHPMEVLPDMALAMRRYNGGGRRGRFTTRGLDGA